MSVKLRTYVCNTRVCISGLQTNGHLFPLDKWVLLSVRHLSDYCGFRAVATPHTFTSASAALVSVTVEGQVIMEKTISYDVLTDHIKYQKCF